jgi:CelD/BcsL family acetyltransferase involved in cellulose biosynthesis
MSSSTTSGGVSEAGLALGQPGTALRRPSQRAVGRLDRARDLERRIAAIHRVEWVTEPERFAELKEQWDWLAARERAPFGRHAWFSAWWDAFGAGGELSICAVWRRQRLVAVLPLWRDGEALRAMANVHTPIFQAPACDQPARHVAFAAALQAAPGALEIEALVATDSALSALVKDSRGAGLVSLVESAHTSPIIDLEGEFADYRRLHAGRCRKLTKLGRRMRREHEVEVTLLEAPVDLDAELDRAFELEAAGWKGAAGTAMASAEDTARFYRSVAGAYQDLGELRLSSVALDGDPAAFDFCLLHAKRVWSLKCGYNEAYRRLSPGNVLLLWEIERAYELGLDAVELLGDREDYKLAFSTSEREHRRFHAYSRRPASLARFAYRRWARPVLKHGYRQLPKQSSANGDGVRWSRLWRGRSTAPPGSAAA